MAQGGGPDGTRRQELSDAPLDHLADVMAGPREGGSGTHNYNSAFAEFTRRQTAAQQEAAEAQTLAARAQQEAAEAAKEVPADIHGRMHFICWPQWLCLRSLPSRRLPYQYGACGGNIPINQIGHCPSVAFLAAIGGGQRDRSHLHLP